MSRIHVFTSAAGNYLPKVKVLFDSLAEHHAEWQRHLLLVEDWPESEVAAVALEAEIHQPRTSTYRTGDPGRFAIRWLSSVRR